MSGAAQAWVCFADPPRPGWLRLLRPGFRHCFVVLREGDAWLVVNSAAYGLEIRLERGIDPGVFFTERGILALPVRRPALVPQGFAWAPFTCVETVKRCLGLRRAMIATPWQLFQYLYDKRNKYLDAQILCAYDSTKERLLRALNGTKHEYEV